MRTSLVCLILFCATIASAAGGFVVSPADAAKRRGQLVTLTGTISKVQSSADAIVLVVGDDPAVPVRIAADSQHRFRKDLAEMAKHRVAATGFLTLADRPLELVVDFPNQLVIDPPLPRAVTLAERVAELEDEVDRLQAFAPAPLGQFGNTAHPAPIRRYMSQIDVQLTRGFPERVEHLPDGRAIYHYYDEDFFFDRSGQLDRRLPN